MNASDKAGLNGRRSRGRQQATMVMEASGLHCGKKGPSCFDQAGQGSY
jgi:hypothetical protein